MVSHFPSQNTQAQYNRRDVFPVAGRPAVPWVRPLPLISVLCFAALLLHSSPSLCSPSRAGFANFALLCSIHLCGCGQRELERHQCELLLPSSLSQTNPSAPTSPPPPPHPLRPSSFPVKRTPFCPNYFYMLSCPTFLCGSSFSCFLFPFSAALITPVFSYNASALSLLRDLLTSRCRPCWSAVFICRLPKSLLQRGHSAVFGHKQWVLCGLSVAA